MQVSNVESTQIVTENDQNTNEDFADIMVSISQSRKRAVSIYSNSTVSTVASTASLNTLSSAIPDEQVRCSHCRTLIDQIRYVCTICGPILTERRRRDLENHLEQSVSEEKEIQRLLETPVSVDTTVNDDESYYLEHQSEVSGGYELCSDCVEDHGVGHAICMEGVVKTRADVLDHAVLMAGIDGLAAVEVGADAPVELRHHFAELMKQPKSSVLGWREVDYEDDADCSICGTGPILTNRFKCLSCTKFDLCLPCYRRIEDIHPIHTFLAVADRPVPVTITNSETNTPRLASLILEGGNASDTETEVAPFNPEIKHEGIRCLGCLQEIIGPRYTCSTCSSFNVCKACEPHETMLASAIESHLPSHILLKLNLPVAPDSFQFARSMALQLMPPPTSNRLGALDVQAMRRVNQASPPGYAEEEGTIPIGEIHQDVCCGKCNRPITGTRWMCAQCGTPTFDLCERCEVSCHLMHDPLHCFIRITIPITHSLPLISQFLPVLYDPASPDPSESSARDSFIILHQDVMCDLCRELIPGAWFRCCSCPAGYDVCSGCLEELNHDRTHVFIKFTRKINMRILKDLSRLDSENPQPLLNFLLY